MLIEHKIHKEIIPSIKVKIKTIDGKVYYHTRSQTFFDQRQKFWYNTNSFMIDYFKDRENSHWYYIKTVEDLFRELRNGENVKADTGERINKSAIVSYKLEDFSIAKELEILRTVVRKNYDKKSKIKIIRFDLLDDIERIN